MNGLLNWILWMPVVGILGNLFIPSKNENAIRVWTLVNTCITLILTLVLYANFDNSIAGMQETTVFANNMFSLSQSSIESLEDLVPSTPALIIVRNNQVQYIGPHSSGANCGEGNSFIDLYQNNLNMGFEQPYANLTQKGCFCRWQNPLLSILSA